MKKKNFQNLLNILSKIETKDIVDVFQGTHTLNIQIKWDEVARKILENQDD